MCAHLMDGKPNQEALDSILLDPNLCPKCKKCNDSDRNKHIKKQKQIKSLIHERCSNVVAPDSLKQKLMSRDFLDES